MGAFDAGLPTRNAGGIKSVQRGVANTSSASADLTIPISMVNINKAFVLFHGYSTVGGVIYPTQITLTNATTLTLKYIGSTTGWLGSWQVVEYY